MASSDCYHSSCSGVLLFTGIQKRKALFGDQVRSNEEIYITDFLCPILKEVFPQAELTLTADYPMNVLQVISPRSTKFDLFHQLSFHDEKNLVVANLYAYHIETRTKRDSSGGNSYGQRRS